MNTLTISFQIVTVVLLSAAGKVFSKPNVGFHPHHGNVIPITVEHQIVQKQPFEFAYGVRDELHGTAFSRQEASDGDVRTGEYQVELPDGRLQIVSYIADENGYRAEVSYEGEAHYDDVEEGHVHAPHAPHPVVAPTPTPRKRLHFAKRVEATPHHVTTKTHVAHEHASIPHHPQFRHNSEGAHHHVEEVHHAQHDHPHSAHHVAGHLAGHAATPLAHNALHPLHTVEHNVIDARFDHLGRPTIVYPQPVYEQVHIPYYDDFQFDLSQNIPVIVNDPHHHAFARTARSNIHDVPTPVPYRNAAPVLPTPVSNRSPRIVPHSHPRIESIQHLKKRDDRTLFYADATAKRFRREYNVNEESTARPILR